MEALFEDYVIKLFNSDDELVGKVTAHEFPIEEHIKAAIRLHGEAAYATVDKVFSLGDLPFSE